jgi:hypothetical protein
MPVGRACLLINIPGMCLYRVERDEQHVAYLHVAVSIKQKSSDLLQDE